MDNHRSSVQPNKGMKLTKLSSAPTLAPQAALRPEVPPSALQRFALVRTASQLIPGVRPTPEGVSVGVRINLLSEGRVAVYPPGVAMAPEGGRRTQQMRFGGAGGRRTLGMRITSLVILGKGVAAFGIGGVELVRAAATGISPLGYPRAPFEPVWPALSLFVCGVCDLASFRSLREGGRNAWPGGVMSALVVLLFAVLGLGAGVSRYRGVLGVAGALALVSLVIFRNDYRSAESRAQNAE